MSNTPAPMPGATRRRILKTLKNAPGRLLAVVRRNWLWKLMALFLALCLWAGLISQDATLTRERVFSDVPLNITGMDSLRRNSGLIVLSGLEPENLSVRMRVEVPQREYPFVTASNYNPRLDLTRITDAGEQTLRVVSSSSSTYGSVEDISPSTVTVVVDEYVTNYRVPVSVNTVGEYPRGFYGSAISRDPSVVAVSGPRTVVDQIARVSVDYNAGSLSPRAGVVRTAIPIRFYDSEGNEIQSNLLEVTSAGVVLRTILVEQTLYPLRQLPISTSSLITGEVAHGYQIKRVSISPATLRAAGDEQALQTAEKLFVDAPVDVNGATETFTAHVRARKPADLAYLSAETLTVTVEIEPATISRTFDHVKLSVRGMGSSLKASADTKNVSLVLTGPQLMLEKLRSAKLSAYVDVTDLEAGEYCLPIEIHIEGGSMEDLRFMATPATAIVTLTAN